MRIDLYHSPYCRICSGAALMTPAGAEIRRMDVTRHIDEAVRLGITHPPAVVVGGRLLAQGTDVPGALERLGARVKP